MPVRTGDPQVDGSWQTRQMAWFKDENDLVRIRHHVVPVLATSGGC
jgi:hypothetical protein